MDISAIADHEVEAVIGLWERCGLTRPWNDPRADIALARRTPTSTVLVGRRAGVVIASAMVGCDGHRGWVYYLAVTPDARGGGLGRRMMEAAEAWVQAQGAPKIQLMVRRGNVATIGFYEAAGYRLEDTVVLGKRFDGRDWTVAPPAGG